MRRRCRPLPEVHLMAHLRSTVWGSAEFVGLPPWRLAAEGLVAGCVTAGVIVGVTIGGAWYGMPGLAAGEGGLVCAAALALYLRVMRAGRALIAIVALLGVCLALQAPRAAVGLVLAERGRVESVVVTSVEVEPGAVPGRYLCSLADWDGVPLKARIWRGCGRATRPGDALAVVYDVKGRVPPRGVEAGASRAGPLRDLVGWVGTLVAACLVAVVRTYRLSAAVSSRCPDRPASLVGP